MTKDKKITAAQMMLMGEIITQECEKGIQLKENKRRFIEVAAKLASITDENLFHIAFQKIRNLLIDEINALVNGVATPCFLIEDIRK